MNVFKAIDTSISKKLITINPKLSFLISLFSYIGSVFSILVFLVIIFVCCDKKIFLLESICSLFYATAIVFILKFTIKRKRNTDEIDKIRQKIDPYSFPSGHISRIFASISPFYNLPYIVVSTFILGTLASIARISKGYHYFTDCFVGMLSGITSSFIAKITLKYLLALLQ
jgi:membrane-associated phospholipid phosphatase